MKPKAAFLAFVLTFQFADFSNAQTIYDERTWTSADETSSFVGTFKGIQSGQVTIEKDGSPLTFSVKKLSQADREFLGQGITVTTSDGKTYENASVSKISASSVTLMLPSGIATVGLEQLPEDMRARFGYDPEAAAKEKEAMAAAQAARQAQLAAMQEAQAKEAAMKAELEKAELRDCYVWRFVEGGLIFNSHSFQDFEGKRSVKIVPGTGWGYKQILDARDTDTQYHLSGVPDEPALVDDQPFSAFMIPNGTYETGGSRIKSYKFVGWGGILYEDDQKFDTPTVVRKP